MPRILLLHASVGMGHQRAAMALAHAFEHRGTQAIVEDTLDHSRPAFRKTYAGSYLSLADRVPMFWSRFYTQTDRPPTLLDPVAAGRTLWTRLGVRGLPALLDELRPDAIICTHFLPMEVLGPLRERGAIGPVYGVVTDYRAHQFWAVAGIDGYFAPTPVAAAQLVAAGIDRSSVHVTGIPVDPALQQPVDRVWVRQTLGLPQTEPVVMLNGSGIAIPRVRAIAEELLQQQMPGVLVIAAGRNRALVGALSDLAAQSAGKLRVLGAQPSLDPLIVGSDLVIGKAGGLTVSEVLSRGVPLIVPTPVPGQEQANAEYIAAIGAGLCRAAAVDVASAAIALLHDAPRRAAMAHAARSAGRPGAAHAVATRVLSDLESAIPPVRFRPSRLALA
jgi:processive 1,2-diacylglycerol beta-glucosyltransferase